MRRRFVEQTETVRTEVILLEGGEDIVTPPADIPPGRLTFSLNYEPGMERGYRRVDGYERFDGRALASAFVPRPLPYTDGHEIVVGDVLTGDTSGATGEVIDVHVEGGDPATGSATGYVVVSGQDPVYKDGEPLSIGGSVVATLQGTLPLFDRVRRCTWIKDAQEVQRPLIEAVPGSGPVRGVGGFQGDVYAWRDNTLGTECVMYKATPTGWQPVDIGDTFFAPGGRFETTMVNFKGTTGSEALYGCDGVNPAFAFDGTGFSWITTGTGDDTPDHIIEHRLHLFLGFKEGSILYSAPGEPSNYDAVDGAGEIALSDRFVGFEKLVGGVLGVFSRNSTDLLYGTSNADWDLRSHSKDSGALEWTLQDVGAPRYLSDAGLMNFSSTDRFGDFQAATFSQSVRPLVKSIKESVVSSIRVRDKDQYRLFFENGAGLIAKFRGESVEITRIKMPVTARVCCSTEDTEGNELLLFGSDDGFVYRMDSGSSFDGSPIEAILRLPFSSLKSPHRKKRFRKLRFEMDASDLNQMEFAAEYDYGSYTVPKGSGLDLDITASGSFWGGEVWKNAEWGEFVWGGQVVGTSDAYLVGSGTNIGVSVRTVSACAPPHTIQTAILDYSLRGRNR